MNFTPTGIRWSDGSTTTGFSVPLFPVTPPPATPTTPTVSVPVEPQEVDEVLDTGGEDPPDATLGVIEIQDHLQQVEDDPEQDPEPAYLLTKEEFDELERLLAPEPVSGTREHYERKNDSLKERRKQIAAHYQGSGDLAGAAEALLSIGGGLAYDQTPAARLPKEQRPAFVSAATANQLFEVTRGNCYEFVHYVAWLAGHAAGKLQSSTGGLRGVLDIKTMKEWDSVSDIPRGTIVVGCVGYDEDSMKALFGGTPQDDYGFIHVGISLGNGLVVSNRGEGAKIEKVEDVFGEYDGALAGGKVYIGQYEGYDLPSSPSSFLEAQRVVTMNNLSDPGEKPDPTDVEATENWKERKSFFEETKGRQAVIQAFKDGTTLQNPTPDQQAYETFLLEGLQKTSEGAPFMITTYSRWQESNAAAKDLSGALATALPVVPPSQVGPQVLTPENESQAGLLRTPDVTAMTGRPLIR